MNRILQAVLDLDVALPYREYVTRVLHILCDQGIYQTATALEVHHQSPPTVLAQHDSPEVLNPAALAIITGRVAALADSADDARMARVSAPNTWGDQGETLCRQFGIQSVLLVPMVGQGTLLGYICCGSSLPKQYADTELRILEKIGEISAAAVCSGRAQALLHEQRRALRDEVAKRQRIEAALHEAHSARVELESMVQRSPVITLVWRADPGWPVDFISKAVQQLGYSTEEITSLQDILYPEDRVRVGEEIARHLESGDNEFVLEYRIITKDGEVRWMENRILVGASGEKPGLLHVITPCVTTSPRLQGVLSDITTRKLSAEALHHQMSHDPVTDLPNRSHFIDRLRAVTAHARRGKELVALVLINLDHFAQIVDTLGQPIGDLLLAAVANRLSGSSRESDSLARTGIDEFSLLATHLRGADDAARVARKVLDTLRIPFFIHGHEIIVTASIGISLFPRDTLDMDTLLMQADAALNSARENGRDTFNFFSPEVNQQLEESISLESEMRLALERDEFAVYYQPRVELVTGRLLGVEALVRWQHPTGELLPPSRFLHVAERSGLIDYIGEWVLREACAQHMRWLHADLPPIPVAVNLSSRQFYHPRLSQIVNQAVADAGMDPRCLELEIPESVAMHGVDYTVKTMQLLHELGVQLSLDNFGIGYSSLVHLRRFPLSAIKIDRSIIRDMAVGSVCLDIAAAVISLAHSLRLRVIAEGVETPMQLAFLQDSQCDGIQGFLHTQPMPPDELLTLFQQQQATTLMTGVIHWPVYETLV